MSYENAWKKIPGLPGYEASIFGEIRSLIKSPFIGKVLKQAISSTGYKVVCVKKGRAYKTCHVRRLVCLAFHGESVAEKRIVAHSNGNKKDNRMINLRWASREENEADKVIHGTCLTGEKNPCAKLTFISVMRAMDMIDSGSTHKAIAKELGVSKSTIGDINTGKIWSHVTGRRKSAVRRKPRVSKVAEKGAA